MKIFADSDGCWANFDLNVFQRFGRYPREIKGEQELWGLINSAGVAFWEEMPLMPGAHELWDRIKHHNPTVLTGCPRTNYEMAAEQKRIWWKKHFDHDDVITCFSRDKALHIRNPGDVLIDDMGKNIKRWEAAGGVGIFHRSNEETIEKLTALGL